MKIVRFALIGISLAGIAAAEEAKAPSREAAPLLIKEVGHRSPSKVTVRKRDDVTNTNSLSVFEIFTGLVIPPGQTLNLFGTFDWTGATSVSIAVACPPGVSLQNAQIFVYWQMPQFTNTYTGTSVLLGSSFLFSNMGGGVVPSFGNQMGLQVKNVGSSLLTCDQLTIYGVVH